MQRTALRAAADAERYAAMVIAQSVLEHLAESFYASTNSLDCSYTFADGFYYGISANAIV
jgi:hypothetical protein